MVPMCPPAKVVGMDELAGQLATLKRRTVRVEGAQLHVEVDDALSGRRAEVIVGLSRDPHVVLEAAEIAELSAQDRADRDAIAGYDARYELTWEPEDTDAVYNTVVTIASKLEKLCGAVVYDANQGRFV